MKRIRKMLTVGLSVSVILSGLSVGKISAENETKTLTVQQEKTLVSYDFSSEPSGVNFKNGNGTGQSMDISDGILNLNTGTESNNMAAVEFDLGSKVIKDDGAVYEISYDFNVESCDGWSPSVLLIASDDKINGVTANNNFYGKAALSAMGNNGTSGWLGSFSKQLKPTTVYNMYARTDTTPKAECNFQVWTANWHNTKIIIDTSKHTADYYYIRRGQDTYTYIGRQDADFFGDALANGISNLQFEMLSSNAARKISLDNLKIKKTINYTYSGFDNAVSVNISDNTIEITSENAFADDANISVVKEKTDDNLAQSCIVSGNKITATLSEVYNGSFDYLISGAVSGTINKVKETDKWVDILSYNFDDGETPDRVSYRAFNNNQTLTTLTPEFVSKSDNDSDKVLSVKSLSNGTSLIDIKLLPDETKNVKDPEIKPASGKYSITYDMLMKTRDNWNPTVRLGATPYWDMGDDWFIFKGNYDMHMNVIGSAGTPTTLSFSKAWKIDPYNSFATGSTTPKLEKTKTLDAGKWVSCKAIVDTQNNRADFYYKLPTDSDYEYVGTQTDMQLGSGMSYNSGIRHLELQVYSGSGSYEVRFDNFNIAKIAPEETSVRFIGRKNDEIFPTATVNDVVNGIKVNIDGTYTQNDCWDNVILKKDGATLGVVGTLSNKVYTITPVENTKWDDGSYTLTVFGKEYSFTLTGQNKEIFTVQNIKLTDSENNVISALAGIQNGETVTATVDVDKYNTDKTAMVILALYNGDLLTDIKVGNVTDTENSVSLQVTNTNDLKVCVYCFDNLSAIIPQATPLIIDK